MSTTIRKLQTYGLAANDFAEYDVFSVEVRRRGTSNEELGSICVLSSICLDIPKRVNILDSELWVELTMERRKGLVCCTSNFSSSNFSP